MRPMREWMWMGMAGLAIGVLTASPARAQRGGRPPPLQVPAPQPPADLSMVLPPDTPGVLRPGATELQLQAARIRSVQSLEGLRQRPRLQLGADAVDLAPLLASPDALPNVAARLRASPDVAIVLGEDSRVYEIDEGVLVRSVVAYRLKPFACTDAPRRRQVQAVGLACPERRSPQAVMAALADPSNPGFVADPRRRAALALRIADADKASRARIDAGVATLRTQLADPAARAKIAAELGAADADRLAGLDAAALEAELAAMQETRIEQVVFVPRERRMDAKRFPNAVAIGGAQREGATRTALMNVLPPPPKTVQAKHSIGPEIFLTGFTLGSQYEWRERVQVTIRWCLLGCAETYYAEAFARLGYGFGLRFPIRFDADYAYSRTGNAAAAATLLPRFEPINGGPGDYAASGLRTEHLYGGKEFVAELSAGAGFGYKVPFFGSNSVSEEVKLDFTQMLPGDFKGGQFDPPAPGEQGPSAEQVFETVDLLGGRANFGIVGAQAFPAVKVSLSSGALRLTLNDNVNASTIEPVSGTPVDLGVNTQHASNFTIGAPVYNVGLKLTPGLQARLFVDVSVWRYDWRPTLWFPQLAVVLPPGGMDFACHADTTCARSWHLTQAAATQTGAEGATFLLGLDQWATDFDAEWLPQCTDDICRTALKFLKLGTTLRAKQMLDANPKLEFKEVASLFAEAAVQAKAIVHESQVRLTQKAGQGWAILAQEIWSKRCSDLPCVQNVGKLAKEMVQAAVDLQKQMPDESSLAVQGKVGPVYGKKFQAEIDASRARAVAAALSKLPPVGPVQPGPVIIAPTPKP